MNIFLYKTYAYIGTRLIARGYLATREIFENMLQLKRFDLYFEGIKEECSEFFEKNYIIDKNDSLSEYINIPLGQNRTNMAPFTPKSTSKLRSALAAN